RADRDLLARRAGEAALTGAAGLLPVVLVAQRVAVGRLRLRLLAGQVRAELRVAVLRGERVDHLVVLTVEGSDLGLRLLERAGPLRDRRQPALGDEVLLRLLADQLLLRLGDARRLPLVGVRLDVQVVASLAQSD